MQVIRLNDDVARQVAGRGDAPRVATPSECLFQGGATTVLNKKICKEGLAFQVFFNCEQLSLNKERDSSIPS